MLALWGYLYSPLKENSLLFIYSFFWNVYWKTKRARVSIGLQRVRLGLGIGVGHHKDNNVCVCVFQGNVAGMCCFIMYLTPNCTSHIHSNSDTHTHTTQCGLFVILCPSSCMSVKRSHCALCLLSPKAAHSYKKHTSNLIQRTKVWPTAIWPPHNKERVKLQQH